MSVSVIKPVIILIATVLSATIAGAQTMNSGDWNNQAESNMRMLPKYGNRPRTPGQRNADSIFIATTIAGMKFGGSRREASDDLVASGFTHLNRQDPKNAMYRFNEAYLLDSTNADIYWGYGAVYMALGSYYRAEEQYMQGLKAAPQNTHLLTDYGTYYLSQYYTLQAMDEKQALVNLDSAVSLLTRSYNINKTDPNTVLKLSVCYWCRGDCKAAWRYYDECAALGGQPISEEYTTSLRERCPRGK